MTRWIISSLSISLICSAALAQSPKKHLLIFRTDRRRDVTATTTPSSGPTRDRTCYTYQVTGATICTVGMPARITGARSRLSGTANSRLRLSQE